MVQALCAALADVAEPVRLAAAQSLSELKSLEAGTLILPWASHADAFVRASALRALRELRLEDAAGPALLALDDADASVRREAVGILGWLKHAPALPALARLAGKRLTPKFAVLPSALWAWPAIPACCRHWSQR